MAPRTGWTWPRSLPVRVSTRQQVLDDGIPFLSLGATSRGERRHHCFPSRSRQRVRGTKMCAIPGRPCKRADGSVGSRDIGWSALSSWTMRQHGSAAIPESAEHSLDVAPRDPAGALVPNLIHLRVLCFISLLIGKVEHGVPVSPLQTRARNLLPYSPMTPDDPAARAEVLRVDGGRTAKPPAPNQRGSSSRPATGASVTTSAGPTNTYGSPAPPAL